MGDERAPVEVHDFPDPVTRIYMETVRALNAGAHILAGGGLRAIVEAICIDQKEAPPAPAGTRVGNLVHIGSCANTAYNRYRGVVQ